MMDGLEWRRRLVTPSVCPQAMCRGCCYVLKESTDLRPALATAQDEVGVFVSGCDDGTRAGATAQALPPQPGFPLPWAGRTTDGMVYEDDAKLAELDVLLRSGVCAEALRQSWRLSSGVGGGSAQARTRTAGHSSRCPLSQCSLHACTLQSVVPS